MLLDPSPSETSLCTRTDAVTDRLLDRVEKRGYSVDLKHPGQSGDRLSAAGIVIRRSTRA